MKNFTIRFRGVRGSYPVANEGFLEYGGNTSCVEVNIDGRLIILDAGTGLISLGEELMKEYINSGTTLSNRKPVVAAVLLSHIHQDHIMGIPFFSPLHIASTRLNVFGNPSRGETLDEELAQVLFNKTFPLDAADIAADMVCSDVNETSYIIIKKDLTTIVTNVCDFQKMKISDDDIIISCYKSFAHPQNGVIVYKIEYKGKSLVYATDKESYIGGDVKLAKFAKNCDCLIHDSQYTTEDYQNLYSPKQGFGHSTFEMAKEMKVQTNAKTLIFFHYEPSYTDEKLDLIAEEYKEENLIFAKEGLEINI